MSTFLATWDIQPGRNLDELIAEAEARLPQLLAEVGAELVGQPHYRIALVMTAPAVASRGVAPYERRQAWADDMMPELGWRTEWDVDAPGWDLEREVAA